MATQPSMLSLEPHKSVPAPFLTKTYHLVDDHSTDHIVSWGDDNSTFVVWRPPEFARDLLPNYFKHNNFSSFVRQLNTYGFRKIVPERWEFANEFFRKGEKHLLCEIHRRKTTSSSSSSSPSHHTLHLPLPNYYSSTTPGGGAFFTSDHHVLPNWCEPSPSPRYMCGGGGGVGDSYNAVPLTCSPPTPCASMLMEDNERLRKSNTILLSELAHMRKLYNGIIYFVQNYVKPVDPSSSSHTSLLPPTAGNGVDVGGGVVRRLLPFGPNHHRPNGVVGSCLNSGSPTSSSSLTIVEETRLPKKNNDNSSSSSSGDEGQCPPKSRVGTTLPATKLFGVSLAPSAVAKKRSLSLCIEEAEEEEDRLTSSPHIPTSTKPGSVLSNDDLGFNLMSMP